MMVKYTCFTVTLPIIGLTLCHCNHYNNNNIYYYSLVVQQETVGS